MTATQKIPQRNEIPIAHTWDLTTIYASDDAWHQDVAALAEMLREIEVFQGTLSTNAAVLAAALDACDRLYMVLERIYVYPMRRRDSDSTDAQAQALAEQADALVAHISASVAFVEPEILAIPAEQLEAWLRDEPALGTYVYALHELLRQRRRVRSAEIEALLEAAEEITRTPGTIYDILTQADLTFGMIADEHGQAVQLSQGRYDRYIRSADRRVRQEAFTSFYQTWDRMRNTIATILASEIRTHILYTHARGYDSCLQAALEPQDIPIDVYTNLITTVERRLVSLHRYMELRKRFLRLDEQHMYDIYAPLTPEIDLTVPYVEAITTIQAALKPLGPDYAATLQQAFTGRWIDVYENVGKASGAYSDGAYTTAPFILLNYHDQFSDMFTVAHELGHAMHAFFTRRSQPYVYGNAIPFVAEVASTLNETLLAAYLLNKHTEPVFRRHLIVQQIENLRFILFRPAMLATFELVIHQQAEAGEALTAASLSRSYHDLVARYHGPDVVIDDPIALEWAHIPPLYRNFYLYQYATGTAAALALSTQIQEEGQPAIDRYLRFLSRGSSRPSIELLRDAGIDMTTPAPILQALDRFDALLDDLELSSLP